ncbi:MAG: glutamate--tRNA ligase [Candidatus Lokiarchaeota archaeon]|nr:glutamate--tRNA ligase [Candidatus Lokiarchaeota archaeon]
MDEVEKCILIEALKNAVKYGEARSNAVIGKIMRDFPEYRSRSEEIKSHIDKIVLEVNSWDKSAQLTKLQHLEPEALEQKKSEPEIKELPELPNVTNAKKVVMRLAPYPSGALHIGNARMLVLNDEYVKRYNGRLLLVYDDTIGATKDAIENDPNAKYIIPEAYDLIREGLEWLGIDYDKNNVIYKSDRVKIYQNYAQDLIQKGEAYVCTCDATVFREKYKKVGKPCPCKELSIDVHLDRWKNMLDGSYEEREAVVRINTGMDQKDPALRDHVIMRISDAEHPRIGTKYRVWPILDFSWGIDDHELGVTHIIRGADLQKEGFMEHYIWDLMGWEPAAILLYGRMRFSNEFILSKTLARQKINTGEYESWKDPRTWSLQSLEARGIQPDALRESLLDLGMSQSGISFSEKWIYAKNTKLIDSDANRYWFVEDPVKLDIINLPKERYVSTPSLHPSYEERGTRLIELKTKDHKASVYISRLDTKIQMSRKETKVRYPKFSEGTRFRLKDLFTVEIQSVHPKKFEARFLTEKVEPSIRKIQWVPYESNVKVHVLKPTGVITHGKAENTIKTVKPGTIMQFERYGYVKMQKSQKNGLYCYFTH